MEFEHISVVKFKNKRQKEKRNIFKEPAGNKLKWWGSGLACLWRNVKSFSFCDIVMCIYLGLIQRFIFFSYVSKQNDLKTLIRMQIRLICTLKKIWFFLIYYGSCFARNVAELALQTPQEILRFNSKTEIWHTILNPSQYSILIPM